MSMSGQDIHFVVELELSLVLTHRQMPAISAEDNTESQSSLLQRPSTHL